MATSSPSTRPGFWQRLFRAAPSPDPVDAAPPLVPPRPVPPPLPKGPGLPAWDEILSAAPPIAEPADAAAAMPTSPAAVAPAHQPVKRPPSEAERQVLAQVAALLGQGEIAQAAAALDAGLRDRPEVCDALGRPVYLLESLQLALLLGADAAASDRVERLRPHLAPDDPVIEVLQARAALAAGDRLAARTHWRAALARQPGLGEARAWLAANPVSPRGGHRALELLGRHAPLPGQPLPSPPPVQNLAPTGPVALPDWLPARLLSGAVLSVDSAGNAHATAAAVASGAASAELALLFRHPDGLGPPHAFAELVLAAFVIHRQFLGHLRLARIYVGRQPWVVPPETAEGGAMPPPQAELLAALFADVRVIGDHDGELREAHLLVVDGAARNAATDTLIGGMMPWVVQWAQDARARAHAACGLPDAAEPPRQPGRRPRVLYLQSAPPRALADPVRERLLGLFSTAGYAVAQADIAVMPWRRQVQLAYGADVITGVHGPAMDIALWAHPQTRVLEFFPEGTCRYDGQLIAEAAGLAYLGLEGMAERGFIIQARQRWGRPVGRGNRLVWALPWKMLEQALAVPQATG